MDIADKLKEIIAEILDIDKSEINDDSYLVRDLNMESIDLLELGVAMANEFKIEVDDNMAFLKDLRLHIENVDCVEKILSKQYPHLNKERIKEIVEEIDNGPVLKFKDVVSYIIYLRKA